MQIAASGGWKGLGGSLCVRGQWPEKRLSHAKREAAEASGGHTFSDGVTLRPPAVCPAGITAWS